MFWHNVGFVGVLTLLEPVPVCLMLVVMAYIGGGF